MKILIVTDAWFPQMNGVVRTLQSVGTELTKLGHIVRFATPDQHMTVPLPTYPEIRLALFARSKLAQTFDEFAPDAVHIATEGPLGLTARKLCRRRNMAFSTAFHTRFPEYIEMRAPLISRDTVYGILRRFHAPAQSTMVSTPTLQRELQMRGFRNTRIWSRGVDVDHFQPGTRDGYERLGLSLRRPIYLYVGRVAPEKNIEAFLDLDMPGSKIVVGDRPSLAQLTLRHPEVVFLGARSGAALAELYASSDVFVFPSLTDTFGLVLLEALASGIPVAAFPVPGPIDVVGNAPVGVLNRDLKAACLGALNIRSQACRSFALARSWRASAEQFVSHLATRPRQAA